MTVNGRGVDAQLQCNAWTVLGLSGLLTLYCVVSWICCGASLSKFGFRLANRPRACSHCLEWERASEAYTAWEYLVLWLSGGCEFAKQTEAVLCP